MQAINLRQKAKVDWLNHGDEASKFLYARILAENLEIILEKLQMLKVILLIKNLALKRKLSIILLIFTILIFTILIFS